MSHGQHHALLDLPASGGELTINGRALGTLVETAGGTPCYLYDRSRIEARVDALRHAFQDCVALHYAIKANPMAALVAALRDSVDGFDVASHAEMLNALNSGADPATISFAGPGKTDFELRAAAAAGVMVAVESRGEFERLARLGVEFGRALPVVLRVNPEFQVKHSGVQMGGVASQFGFDVEHARALLAGHASDHVDIRGLHVFAGSQNLDAGAVIDCFTSTVELVRELAPLVPNGLRYVNLGGGFGVPYFSGEAPLDIERVGAALQQLTNANADLLSSAESVIELGRYLVAEAGYYVTRVTDVKTSRGKCFAVVDGGMHHHLANSGNLGQVIRRNFPIVVGNKMGTGQLCRTSIVGPLCTPLDMVGADLELPALEVGDLVVVLQSGAYGRSASPLGFLSRPEPTELLV